MIQRSNQLNGVFSGPRPARAQDSRAVRANRFYALLAYMYFHASSTSLPAQALRRSGPRGDSASAMRHAGEGTIL